MLDFDVTVGVFFLALVAIGGVVLRSTLRDIREMDRIKKYNEQKLRAKLREGGWII